MDKLLPCPFCGNDAPDFYQDKNGAVVVVCPACNAEGPWELRASEALAAMDWNRRAPAAPAPALLALAFSAERWEADESVIVMSGVGPIGQTMSHREAHRMADWLNGTLAPAIAALLAPDGADGADGAGEVVRECKCRLRTRLVGDGCDVCNPELAAEHARQREVADGD